MRKFKIGDHIKVLYKDNSTQRAILVPEQSSYIIVGNHEISNVYRIRMFEDGAVAIYAIFEEEMELDKEYYRELSLNKVLDGI